MTHIFKPEPHEAGKWRKQADQAGAHLKSRAEEKDEVKLAFVLNDGIIKVTVKSEDIRNKTAKELADMLYNLVLAAAQVGGTA